MRRTAKDVARILTGIQGYFPEGFAFNIVWDNVTLTIDGAKHYLRVNSTESHVVMTWRIPIDGNDALCSSRALRRDLGLEPCPAIEERPGWRSKRFLRQDVIETGNALMLCWP